MITLFCRFPTYTQDMKIARLTRKQMRESLDQVPFADVMGIEKRALTHKQQQFAKNVAHGDTGAEAYRKAYRKGKTPVKPKVAGNRASKLKGNEVIQMEIEAIKRAIAFQTSHTTAQLRALVVSQLTKEALNEENPPASRLTALKALGTVAGVDAFLHISEQRVIKDSDTARADMMAQLKRAIADNMRTIDASGMDDADELLALISKPALKRKPVPAAPPTPDTPFLKNSTAQNTHSIPDKPIADLDDVPHTDWKQEGEGGTNSQNASVNIYRRDPPVIISGEKG